MLETNKHMRERESVCVCVRERERERERERDFPQTCSSFSISVRILVYIYSSRFKCVIHASAKAHEEIRLLEKIFRIKSYLLKLDYKTLIVSAK